MRMRTPAFAPARCARRSAASSSSSRASGWSPSAATTTIPSAAASLPEGQRDPRPGEPIRTGCAGRCCATASEWQRDRLGRGLRASRRAAGRDRSASTAPPRSAAYLGNPNVHHFGHIAYLPALLKLLRTPNLFSASSVDQWPHQFVSAQMYGHQFLLPIPDIDRTDYFLMLGANPVASNGSLMTAPGIAQPAQGAGRARQAGACSIRAAPRPRRSPASTTSSARAAMPCSWSRSCRRCCALGPPRIAAYEGTLDGPGRRAGRDRRHRLPRRRGAHRHRRRHRRSASPREFHAAPARRRLRPHGRVGAAPTARCASGCCSWSTCHRQPRSRRRRAGRTSRRFPITGPGTAPGQRGRWRSRVRGLPEFAGELPVAVLAEEIVTPGAGQVRALLTVRRQPGAVDARRPRASTRRWQALDFMVAIDIYINETTRHADLILPPASPLTPVPLRPGLQRLRGAPGRAPERAAPRARRRRARRLGNRQRPRRRATPRPRASPGARCRRRATLIAAGLARGGTGLTIDELEAAPHGIDLGPAATFPAARGWKPRAARSSARRRCCWPNCSALARDAGRDADAVRCASIGRRDVRSNNSWMHNAPRLVKGKPRHQLLMHPSDLARARHRPTARACACVRASASIETEVLASDRHDARRGLPAARLRPRPRRHRAWPRAGTVAGASYNDLSDPLALDGACGNAALNGLAVEVEPVAIA